MSKATVYRPTFGASPLDGGGVPYEIINEGSETGVTDGPGAEAADEVIAETGEGGVVTMDAGDDTPNVTDTAPATPDTTSPAITPTMTKAALEQALREANAAVKKWKTRFWVAAGIGTVAAVGGTVGGYYLGKHRIMKGMEDVGDAGMGDVEGYGDEGTAG